MLLLNATLFVAPKQVKVISKRKKIRVINIFFEKISIKIQLAILSHSDLTLSFLIRLKIKIPNLWKRRLNNLSSHNKQQTL